MNNSKIRLTPDKVNNKQTRELLEKNKEKINKFIKNSTIRSKMDNFKQSGNF